MFNMRRTWGPLPTYPKVVEAKSTFGPNLIVVAGPCSVEDGEQMNEIVPVLRECGVLFARGGVYRAGTYPGRAFGFKKELAEEWARKCHEVSLGVVVEILDIRQIEDIDKLADAFQVGARHMQDYALLSELAKTTKPVFLKRNMGATLDEFLGAAEYLVRGKPSVVLVERGSSTHMNHVRWDLSVSTIAALKSMTKLSVLIDPSHGTGRHDLVKAMTFAGVAAGADGFMVEVHPDPERSLSDAEQAYPLEGLKGLVTKAQSLRQVLREE